jgi:hypothetical protein
VAPRLLRLVAVAVPVGVRLDVRADQRLEGIGSEPRDRHAEGLAVLKAE